MDTNLKRVAELSGGPLLLPGVALDAQNGVSGPLVVEYTGGVAQVKGQRADLSAAQALMAVAPMGVVPLPKTAAVANVPTRAGLLTINGYTLTDGDLLLLTAQSTTTQNGLWMAHADDASGAVVWTRPNLPVYSGQLYYVQGGTAVGTMYRLSTTGAITPGTTAQSFDEIATGGGGPAFDPTNPGPIGGSVPAAGTFTALIGTLGTGWAIGADGRPTADVTYKLGTSAYRFTEMHVKKIVAGPNTDGNGYLRIESGSDARGLILDTSRPLSAPGALLVEMGVNGTGVFAIGSGGEIGTSSSQLHALPGGTGTLTAEVGRGQATLVAGTVTVTMTGIQNTSKVIPTLTTPGGTMGARLKVGVTGGSGFTLTAVDTSGATVATDTSVYDYVVLY